MARGTRSNLRFSSRQFRASPYPIPSCKWKVPEIGYGSKKTIIALEKMDWKYATCSVCMEYPHNAVLLLCSSHEKGCRPYMCGTSFQHSNCLDQFKKAYTKLTPDQNDPAADNQSLGLTMDSLIACEKSETTELFCPLCRGQVKGWTVVDPAREYLNNKKRSCMQENCSFVGTYKELRKHVKSVHPSAKPREVDPVLEQKWRTLEHDRGWQDVISTIRSSMPRSVVFGDYVIEMNSDLDTEDEIGEREDVDFNGRSRGISRSILYFFMREGARLMRLQREYGASESREDELHVPTDARNDSDPSDASQPRSIDRERPERRQRRRRHRSQVRSVSGVS